MKKFVGDVVVYTPPLTKLVSPYTGAPRYVVVGIVLEDDYDDERIWVSEVTGTEEPPEPATLEESGHFTVVVYS